MFKIALIAVVLLVAVVVIFRTRRMRAQESSTEIVPVASPGSSEDGDATTLRELGKLSDLSKVHPVEFFLYFPEESAARTAGETLAARGFTVEVRPAAKGQDWLCFAVKPMVPELAALRRIRKEFDELTGRLGGDYDGWGSPVVK
jgi:hypothetical protein